MSLYQGEDLGLWAKIRFVPFTRYSLNNVKVRKELGQNVRDLELEGLQLRYEVMVDTVETSGLCTDSKCRPCGTN